MKEIKKMLLHLAPKKLTVRLMLITVVSMLAACNTDESENKVSGDGEPASTARFTIQKGHLIAVESQYINVFSLSDPAEPDLINEYFFPWAGIETIYPYESDSLLLGSIRGAYIFDHSVPGQLKQLSFSAHSPSCDPVVANDDYMYVTIRSGLSCDGDFMAEVNQLMTYDISDSDNPVLTSTIKLNQPYGLAILDKSLFVCAKDALHQFDISQPDSPKSEATYPIVCNDLIVSTDPIIITSDTEIILATKTETDLQVLSRIKTGE